MQESDFLGFGVCPGRLFLIDFYPGLAPSDDPDDLILGELYILRDPANLLPLLDHYEGIGPEYPEPAEYTRERRQIRLNNGGVATAWVYIYQHSTEGLLRIDSGDFLADLSKNTRTLAPI